MNARNAAALCCILGAAALAAGCASTPATPQSLTPSASLGCPELQAEIDRVEAARRAALDRQQDAWKAVVPFAVIGRHAGARKDAAEAGQRLDALKAGLQAQGCAGAAG